MASGTAQAPPASSFALLLAQAVESGDADLLDFIFSHKDYDTARKTLAPLREPAVVEKMVRMMLAVIEGQPKRAAAFTFWLRALLLEKSELLAANADCVRFLQTKRHFFSAKAENVCELIALRGRLRLLSRTAGHDALLLGDEPLVVADERTEDEEAEEGLGVAFGREQEPAPGSEGEGEEEMAYEAAEEDERESASPASEDEAEMLLEEDGLNEKAHK